MLYLAWDREINISLFFCDVFVWKWGPRPRTSSRCYHGNKSAATFKKGIFVHPPECLTACKIWTEVWKFSFPKIFDSYRDSFLTVIFCGTSVNWTGIRQEERNNKGYFTSLSHRGPIDILLTALNGYFDSFKVMWLATWPQFACPEHDWDSCC